MTGCAKGFVPSYRNYKYSHSRRHEYETIALGTESKYYSPILLNKETVTKSEENNELLSLADNLCKDGLFVLGGNVPHPESNYVGDRLAEAFEVLSGQNRAGNPILPIAEISSRIDRYGLDTLMTLAIRDIENMDDPMSAAADYVNGKDYVAEINSSRGPMIISSSSLSDGAQSQFRQNIESAIIKNLNSKGARENFSNGRHLMAYPATYCGTTEQHNGLDVRAKPPSPTGSAGNVSPAVAGGWLMNYF